MEILHGSLNKCSCLIGYSVQTGIVMVMTNFDIFAVNISNLQRGPVSRNSITVCTLLLIAQAPRF